MRQQYTDDQEFVERMLAGDESAFDFFVDQYYPRLYRFAASRLDHDPEVVQDVVQGTFEKVMPKLAKFRGESLLLTWMCSFCRYEIAAYWRSAKKHSREIELVADAPDVRAGLERIAALESGPEAELERREVAGQVREALSELPAHYENILSWKYMHGLSVREIAERLDTSPKAAESMLTRARQAFRDGFSAVVGG